MRATLSVAALRRVLSVAARAVERRVTIPILECLHLSVEDGALCAQGTNLDMWISAKASASGCQEGAICVSRRVVDAVHLPDYAEAA